MDGQVRRRAVLGLGGSILTALTGCGSPPDRNPGEGDEEPSPAAKTAFSETGTEHCEPSVPEGLSGTGANDGWATTGATQARSRSIAGPGLSLDGVDRLSNDNIVGEWLVSLADIALVDGTAYCNSNFKWCFAVDVESGDRNWVQPTGGGSQAPLVVDDTVFATGTLTLDGDMTQFQSGVHAFDAASGDRKWFAEVPSGPEAPPALAAGTLVVGCRTADREGALVLGLDPTCGAERWRYTLADDVVGWTLARGDTVFLATCDEVVAVNATDGSERWHTELAEGETYRGSPILAGEAIVAVLESGAVVALDAADGAERWRHPDSFGAATPPTGTAEHAYVTTRATDGSGIDAIAALSLADGTVAWTIDSLDLFELPPTVAGETLYYVSSQAIGTADAATGESLHEAEIDGVDPVSELVVGSDALYLLSKYEGGTRLYRYTPDE